MATVRSPRIVSAPRYSPGVLLALLHAALAAVPFQLPAGEVVADWAAPMALAGFAPGPAGAAPSVILEPDGGAWRLVVVDVDGGHHTTRVVPPRSSREREDLVWVAQSLINPMVPAFRTPRASPPPPRRPRPSPVEVPEVIPDAPIPPVAEVIVEPEPVPVPVPVPAPVPPTVEPVPEPPPRLHLRAAASGGVRVREGVDPTPIVTLAAGVAGTGWDARIELVEVLPAGLDTGGLAEGEVAGERGLIEVRVGPDWSVAPGAALGFGLAHHRFQQADTPVADAWVPVLAATAALQVRADDHLAIELTTRATWDTRALNLQVDGVPIGGWSPWAIEPGLALVFAPR